MRDYLFRFSTAAKAKSILAAGALPREVVVRHAVYGPADEEGVAPLLEPRQTLPGIWASLPREAADDAPYDQSGCIAEIDRDSNGVLRTRDEAVIGCWLEPVYAGSDVGALVAVSAPPEPAAPVPEVISDRQFAQALALDGTITEAEALAWAARGELPEAMETALGHIPEAGGQRFGARMMLAAATTYERRLPLTEQLGALLGYDAAALDALWTRAASL